MKHLCLASPCMLTRRTDDSHREVCGTAEAPSVRKAEPQHGYCSLEDSREPGLRLYIHRDMAFVYHPIVLEGPATTYLISWGNTVVNANIKRYLTEPSGRPADGIYHLLVKNTGRVSVLCVILQRKTRNRVILGHMVLSRQTTIRCG